MSEDTVGNDSSPKTRRTLVPCITSSDCPFLGSFQDTSLGLARVVMRRAQVERMRSAARVDPSRTYIKSSAPPLCHPCFLSSPAAAWYVRSRSGTQSTMSRTWRRRRGGSLQTFLWSWPPRLATWRPSRSTVRPSFVKPASGEFFRALFGSPSLIISPHFFYVVGEVRQSPEPRLGPTWMRSWTL